MEKPIISCINLGYYQVKADNQICFKSKAKQTTDDKNLSVGDVIELDGKKYILEIGQPMLESDKTTSDLTKVFILNVLCKRLEDMKIDEGVFNLLVTAPPVSFKRQSEALPEFLKGKYEVKYNNKSKEIEINSVVVLPETFLVYTVNNPSKLRGKKTLIIDIGGRTTNICLLTDCKFNLDDYATISKGMYHIDTNIATALNEKHYKTYSEEDIDIKRKQGSKLLQENIEILDSIYAEHTEEILKFIQTKSWEIDNETNVLVCGGGGIILFDFIKEIFPHAKLTNDPLYDNLNALQLVAEDIFD